MARRSRWDIVNTPVSELGVGDAKFFNPEEDRYPDQYPGAGKVKVVVPTYLVASDYSGNDGGIVRANYNVFTDNFADLEGTYWWRISGGYGTFGVAVLDDAHQASRGTDEEDQVDAMLAALAGLADYPYLEGAEEEETDVQMNAETEQWEEFGARDFRKVLLAALFEDASDAEVFEETLDNLGADRPDQSGWRDALHALYYGLGDIFSVYPEFEGSGDNIAAVWRFDDWAERLKPVIEAWEESSGENYLRARIMAAILESDRESPAYGGQVHTVVAWTYNKARTAASIPVVQDWIEERGGGEAAWSAILRGEKFAGLIPGGTPAGDRPDSDFDPVQLRAGIKTEMEHTSNRRVAATIAKAHLTESPNYYKLLKKMERKF